MKDYYQILGIGDRASQEEIHDRWRELTALFPPGSEGGAAGNERIAEINEAYQALKTPKLKFEYDLRRNFQRSVLRHLAYYREKRKIRIKKMASYGSALAIFLGIGSFTLFFEAPWVTKEQGSVVAPENTRFAGPDPALKSEEYEKSEKLESYAKFAETVPPALPSTESPREVEDSLRVSPPGDERESEPIREKSVTAAKEPEKPDGTERIALMEPSRPETSAGSKESQIAYPLEANRKSDPIKEASRIGAKEPEGPGGSATVAPLKSREKEAPEVSKEPPLVSDPVVQKKSEPPREAFLAAVKKPEERGGSATIGLLEPSRKAAPREPRESPAAALLEAQKKSEPLKEIPDSAFKVPGLPAREAKAIPLQPNRTVIPEVAKTPTSSFVLPATSRESEVRQFLARYADRYNQKDIDAFLSFFSPKAVQNQKDDIEQIRKVYATFFRQNEELRYNVRNVKIEPHKDGLQVMADYELEGVMKKGKERKVWRGQVRWVLIEEKGTLKVLSLDYRPQKSRD
jgi:curved DNA-binding protein CbpA/ketosteroid isomerase-like protein